MTTFTVRAKRWKRLWELDIEGVGVTQATRLNKAADTAVSYITMVLGPQAEDIQVTLIPEVGEDVDERVRAARLAVRVALDAQEAASRQSRQVIRLLEQKGLTKAEVAAVLAVSPQRVSQLSKTPVPPAAPPSTASVERAETPLLRTREDVLRWAEGQVDQIWAIESLGDRQREELALVLRAKVAELLALVDKPGQEHRRAS